MENYAVFSIETHLFFARIMKEHALFLQAGFPCKDEEWIQRADHFRRKFEELLSQAIKAADGMVERNVLESRELVTEFTIPAEQRTSCLTGIDIDSEITEREKVLRSGRIRGGLSQTSGDGKDTRSASHECTDPEISGGNFEISGI